jgi:general secretion pathway protein K
MSRYREIRARVRGRRAESRRGVALILVLGSLVVLMVFVTELQQTTSASVSAAVAERDAMKAEYNARSAVNLSRLLIATEPMVRQAIDPLYRVAMKSAAPQIPVWKFADMVLGPFNCPAKADKFQSVVGSSIESGKNLGASAGCFDLVIVDEDAKINLNSAVNGDQGARDRLGAQLMGLYGAPQFNELFEAQDGDGQYSNQPVICGAMVDWADFDEQTYPCDPTQRAAEGGPEDNYYQAIDLPYVRKNAPYDSIEELHLVRGVSDDFWANFVDPNPNNPGDRVLTVWGQGKINVNTANPQTILAVVCAGAPLAPVCIDPTQMSTFLTALTLARELTQGAPLFKSAKSFTRAMAGKGKGIGPLFAFFGLEPIEFTAPRQVEKAITTESKVFSLYAEGIVPGRHRETRIRTHTVVDFRSANELGATQEDPDQDAGQQQQPPSASPDQLTPEQLVGALASDPMGVIIYHRIE